MAKRGGFPGGGMPGNMANLMKQAQKMQRQMEENQKELEEKEFTAKCAAGDGKAIKLSIDGLGSNGKEIGAKFSGVSGVHDLYIVLPDGCELINWSIL